MTKTTEAPLAVVTGGASGIGEAAVRRFADHGWRVAIVDINDQRGQGIADELAADGAVTSYHHLDVADADAVSALTARICDRLGVPAAVVNSGGILQNAVRITRMKVEEFERIIDINVKGTMLVSRAFGERMAESGRGGSIVNLCSLTSFFASPQPAYATSKAAVKMLTEVMAADLGPQGVRVNAVAPGYTLTPAMQQRIDSGQRDPKAVIAKSALRRFVEPSEVGDAIYFLCSPQAAAITGVTLPVDAGWLVYAAYSSAAAQPE